MQKSGPSVCLGSRYSWEIQEFCPPTWGSAGGLLQTGFCKSPWVVARFVYAEFCASFAKRVFSCKSPARKTPTSQETPRFSANSRHRAERLLISGFAHQKYRPVELRSLQDQPVSERAAVARNGVDGLRLPTSDRHGTARSNLAESAFKFHKNLTAHRVNHGDGNGDFSSDTHSGVESCGARFRLVESNQA